MNNRIYLDVLHTRRPTLNYVSPAICDAVFSSTSFPVLVLDSLPVKAAITGLRITFIGTNGDFIMSWDNYPGALCYSVYKLNDATDPFGDFTLIAECISDAQYDPYDWEIPFNPHEPGCYIVTAITLEGETVASDPICTDSDGDGVPDGFIPTSECISNTSPLADGQVGDLYSVTLTPDGPAAGPQWTITAGALPTGLTLDINTGEIAGTPTMPGDFTFTVRLTKDGGGFCEEEFTIEVNPSDEFVWDAATISEIDGGIASFSPDLAYGNVATSQASQPGGINGILGAAQNFGRLLWRSDVEVPCNMHLEISSVGTNPDPTLLWAVSITVVDPASTLVNETDQTLGLNGIFDVPFNLPNTGGAVWEILWSQTSLAASADTFQPGSNQVIATFTIV